MQERFEAFTVLINKISRNIRKIKNQEMAAYHLRSVHVSCLYYIYLLEGVTSADLCEHCEKHKATIAVYWIILESTDSSYAIPKESNGIKALYVCLKKDVRSAKKSQGKSAASLIRSIAI